MSRLLVILLSLAPLGCVRNPATGKRELALVSEKQEIRLGQQAAQQVVQQIGLVEEPAVQAYVDELGQKLAAESERPDLPWSFQVVDDPTPNAFALPGGQIFVTRGMLNLMNSEAELVSVLGHEIGHVTARHSVQAITRQQVATVGLGVGAILAPDLAAQFGDVALAGMQLLFLKYGRDDERQADDLGFRYALDQGYDVREMADVFSQLQRVGKRSGQSPLPSWLSTHPYPEERVEDVKARVAELGPRRLADTEVGREDFLARIDGLTYGDDPRNGFFRGGEFVHPELAFRLDLPDRWETANLPQAVIALSPQRDAAIELTVAGDLDPTAAVRQFVRQPGVRPGESFQQTVHGLPAVGTSFVAQTQQGVVQGLVAFVSYQGTTYQIVGYAPEGRFGRFHPDVSRTITSFRPLTDRELLDVDAPRVEVVRVDTRMTLEEFDRRWPSVIPMPELALINQLPNRNAVLEPGDWVKRVVADRPQA